MSPVHDLRMFFIHDILQQSAGIGCGITLVRVVSKFLLLRSVKVSIVEFYNFAHLIRFLSVYIMILDINSLDQENSPVLISDSIHSEEKGTPKMNPSETRKFSRPKLKPSSLPLYYYFF